MTDTEHPEFPCESFKDAARHMRRPFTPAAVKFKVQATWPKDAPTGGLIVAYIDARLAVERLNLLVPHLWSDSYRPTGQGQMWCDLTIDAITRSDVGEGVGKGLVSDSLKRAAVRFGIGVSLYAIPKMMLNVNGGALKPKQSNKGPTLELTPQGESILRASYEHWLDAHGKQAFGDALDHGDVEDAAGDHEDGEAPVVPDGVNPETGEVKTPPSDAVVAELRDRIVALKDADVWTSDQIRSHLTAAGAQDTGAVGSALRTLSAEQADEFLTAIKAIPLPEPVA